MQKEYEAKYHNLEANHFWFKARRSFILDLVQGVDKKSKILDVGCSSGLLIKDLANAGHDINELYGIDISKEAIGNCKENGIINAFIMDGHSPEFDHLFDIIIASDNLEHLKNDELALSNWFNCLKPGGKVYIFVPAFMALWSHHDEVNMHFRRYRKNELSDKLIKAGFSIQRKSYWNVLLFLPLYLKRKFNNLTKKHEQNKHGDIEGIPSMNNFLFRMLQAENSILKHIPSPFGVSTFCIAEKPR